MKYAALTLAVALGLCASAQAATPAAAHVAVAATKLGVTSGAAVLKAADTDTTKDTKAKKKKKKKKPESSNS
jgi:Skp family chaperone for outer membrane proteins